MTPERLGPYELVRPIGRGGMGEVWSAVLHGPAGFRKPVALKCLPEGRLADPTVRDALLREARLGGRLQHPNVVGTLGLSEHEGTWVIALELVHGASLAQLFRQVGPLPPLALLDAGMQAAAGLAHAHAAGLVHRDVKPANLLLDRTGLVKVADLGISVAAGEDSGSIAGTPSFMAPEQAAGHATPASDQFSLAATLYALATGRLPFGKGTAARHAIEEVELRLASGALLAPADDAVSGLAEVLYRCFRADPGARFDDVRQLGQALADLRPRQPEGPTLLALLAQVRPDLVAEPATPITDQPTSVLPAGNVPPPRDRFVGRASELEAVRALVLEPSTRLVSLLGPGGMGKTRLALEVARAIRRELHGGAWALDLAEARSVDGICAAVARALGLELEAGDPVGQLGRALASRGRALWIFDNLEQCAAHLPSTLGRWLDLATEATFLATSRVPTGLAGERPVPLGPLESADGVALFGARATRPIEAHERADVEAICASVDGMPLAIELAAARVRLLGVARVRERLSLTLLSGGRRDLPERHRSLEASLDWSTALLSPSARDGLGQLAVFDGGFDLEAAEAILDVAGATDALGVLEELVDASLIRVDPSSSRFSMQAMIEQYAERRLPSPEAALRHGLHFAQLGREEALLALDGPGGPARRRALALELDNLMVACRRAVARRDASVAGPTLLAAWAVLELQGPFPLAAELAERVAGLPAPARLAARIRAAAGRAAHHAGRSVAARAHLEAAVAAARAAGDRGLVADALGHLGMVHHDSGRVDDAEALLVDALARHREAGSRRGEGWALDHLGVVHHSRGRVTEARQCFEAALQAYRAVGDRRAEAGLRTRLANLLHDGGEMALAGEHYRASLQAHREVGDRRGEGVVLGSLGLWHRDEGRLDQARQHLDAALALHREVGDRAFEGNVLGNLGILERAFGREHEARTLLEAALQVHRETGSRRLEGTVLGNLGLVEQDLGRSDEARACYEAALAVHREVGNRRSEGITLLNLGDLQRQLGDTGAARASFDAALAALREVGLRRAEGYVRILQGRLALAEGLLEEAAGHLAAAEEGFVALGDAVHRAVTLAARAELRARAGDADAARAALAEAEAVAPAGSGEARRAIDEARAVTGD